MKQIILSIKGGGIRGIIPCCHLVELERQTGKPAREVISGIGGCSTGALLTAVVAAGVPATAALDVYLKRGNEVFAPVNSWSRQAQLFGTGHRFDNRVLHQVVADTLGSQAGMLINDAPLPLVIMAGDQMGNPVYFTQDRATNASAAGRAPLVDAAVASACATTYHKPWKLPGYGYYSDGGTVSLSDPVYETIVELCSGDKMYGAIAPDPQTLQVVSLGTGFYAPPVMPDPPDSLLANISWVTSSLVGSSKTLAVQAADRQWPGLVKSIDVPLWADVDEADVESIPQLLELGRAEAKKIDWLQILKG